MSSSKSAKRRRRMSRHLKASTGLPPDLEVTLTAVVDFDADSLLGKCKDKPRWPRFALNAYNGGRMRPSGYPHDVIVDLAGVVHDGQVPVFMDHDVSGKGLVGHAEVTTNGSIDAMGVVSADTEAARVVVESAKRGFPWQVSIGANVDKRSFVKAGEYRTINGQKFAGPFYHVKSSRLHELSFVPIGADSSTSATIAANKKERKMSTDRKETATTQDDVTATAEVEERQFDKAFEEWLEAREYDVEEIRANWSDKQLEPLTAMYDRDQEAKEDVIRQDPSVQEVKGAMQRQAALEITRQTEIRRICRFHHELCAQAIAEGWTPEQAELKMLKIEASRRPTSTVGGGSKAPSARVIEAAMCRDAGMPLDWLDASDGHWKDFRGSTYKGYSERELDEASDLGTISFNRLFHEYLRAAGVSIAPGTTMSELIPKVRDTRRALRASTGFSTVDIDGILSNVMGKRLLQMFETVPPVAQRISSNRSVKDFKETKAFRLTGNGDFLQVGPTGELQSMGLQEEEYANKPVTYGRMLSVSREMLINDDIQALAGVTKVLGHKAATKLQRTFFELWMGTGGTTLFTAGNGNLITNVLGIAGLTAGETAFLNQTDADGDPISVGPSILLVPNELKVTAEEMMNQTTTLMYATDTTATAAVRYPDINPHAGKWTIEYSPWIGNSNITGYSTTAWYLIANPNVLSAAEIVYLDGKQSPVIESEDADFSTLGFQWRAYFDFGIAVQDYRAAVKSAGTG